MLAFDYDRALAAADGNEELLRELINLYKQESHQLLGEIEQAVSDSQADQLQRAAHRFRGAAANVGSMAVYEVALALETMGKSNELEAASEGFAKLKGEIDSFNKATANIEKAALK